MLGRSAARFLVLPLAAAGAALGGALAAGTPAGITATAAWCAAAVAYLGEVWLRLGRLDAAATMAHARADDPTRTGTRLTVLLASVASLVAVGSTLVYAGHHRGREDAVVALAVLAVALSWSTVHSVYTLRYGGLYYTDPIGGIDFEDGPPSYLDFAYFAFTIGMTYQVSDTGISTKRFRSAVLGHSLLSFVFGAVIVAVTINLVASLLKP